MFKTILKTLALSAATLTLLSACGASDALNAAIRAYEASLNERESGSESGAGTSGFLSAGSGKEEGDSEDDEEYLPAVLPVIRDTIDRDTVVQRIEEQPIRRQLTAEESRTIEELIAEEFRPDGSPKGRQATAEDALLNESPKGRLLTAEESRAIEEQPIGELADPEESRHIEEQPIVIAEDARLVEIEKEIEKQRIAEETRLAEIEKQRIAEENPPVEEPPISYEEENRRAILAEKQRIQDELKEDPSAFSTTSSRVASIRVTGTHDGGNNYDITRSKTQDIFGISKDEGEDPGLIMTVNSVGHKVVPYIHDLGFSDGKVTIYYNEKGVGPYFTGSADIKKIIRGTHATIQGDYVGYATDMTDYGVSQSVDYTRGYATIGVQTSAPVVGLQTAVATYNGTGGLLADLSSGDDNFWRSSSVSITMNVDFDANTIAGTGTERTWGNKITFNSAPIVGNGFEGTFAMNDRLRDRFNLDGNPTGQYSGNFFGPNADDLAGVMSFEGASRDLGVDIIGYGGFRADRQ